MWTYISYFSYFTLMLKRFKCSYPVRHVHRTGSFHWLSHCNEICVHWTRLVKLLSHLWDLLGNRLHTFSSRFFKPTVCLFPSQVYNFSWINIPKQLSPSALIEHVWLTDTKWPSHMRCLPLHNISNWMTSTQYPVCYQWDYAGMLTTGNLLSQGLTSSHL